MTSIHDRVAAARHRLRDAGLAPDEADLSARILAEHVLGWSTEQFFTNGFEPEPDGFGATYAAAVARRAAREPLPYITGEREFWGLTFEVTPDVLIPRPETEIIVEAALEAIPQRAAAVRIADACTGSGCIGIAIATERPAASLLATDISAAALHVARRNAIRHGVADRVQFIQTDLLDGVGGPFDVIVANPPYVRSGDRNGLQPEVREEPAVALYAGPEGLDAIARLVRDASPRLRAGGFLIFEFGLGQDLEIERLIRDNDQLAFVELRRDLQGIARTAVARQRPVRSRESGNLVIW
jgi:release factor glutamine methyltransferase